MAPPHRRRRRLAGEHADGRQVPVPGARARQRLLRRGVPGRLRSGGCHARARLRGVAGDPRPGDLRSADVVAVQRHAAPGQPARRRPERGPGPRVRLARGADALAEQLRLQARLQERQRAPEPDGERDVHGARRRRRIPRVVHGRPAAVQCRRVRPGPGRLVRHAGHVHDFRSDDRPRSPRRADGRVRRRRPDALRERRGPERGAGLPRDRPGDR